MSRVLIEPYPFGKRFAVSLLDDTDGSTLSNIIPIYELLSSSSILTTKTVWPLDPVPSNDDEMCFSHADGSTLQNGKYREYCEKLHSRGFEIAMHTASSRSSPREETIKAYELYETVFGHFPITNIMHSRNRENIYWGKDCVPNPALRKLISFFEPKDFFGHIIGSKYFWGDICREKTRYVRLFDVLETNTIKFDPAMPYHDPKKEYVNWWFSTTYGAGTRIFEVLSPREINKLRKQRGASVVHYYCRHYSVPRTGGEYAVHPKFEALIRSLSQLTDGYYVPVWILLDRLCAIRRLQSEIKGRTITIRNHSSIDLPDLTLQIPKNCQIRDQYGKDLGGRRNQFDQINIGTLHRHQTIVLRTEDTIAEISNPRGIIEADYLRLFLGHINRVGWQIRRGRWSMNKYKYKDPPWVTELLDIPVSEGVNKLLYLKNLGR